MFFVERGCINTRSVEFVSPNDVRRKSPARRWFKERDANSLKTFLLMAGASEDQVLLLFRTT